MYRNLKYRQYSNYFLVKVSPTAKMVLLSQITILCIYLIIKNNENAVLYYSLLIGQR